MASLIRREPYEVPALNRFFSTILNDPFFSEGPALAAPLIEEGTLALDLSEDEKNVVVRASLPGFKRESINVEVNDGVLSIKAEQTDETEEKSEKYYRKERRFGSVSRRVALPSTVLEHETNAELKDGVLTLRIPKSPKAMPRKVKIN